MFANLLMVKLTKELRKAGYRVCVTDNTLSVSNVEMEFDADGCVYWKSVSDEVVNGFGMILNSFVTMDSLMAVVYAKVDGIEHYNQVMSEVDALSKYFSK